MYSLSMMTLNIVLVDGIRLSKFKMFLIIKNLLEQKMLWQVLNINMVQFHNQGCCPLQINWFHYSLVKVSTVLNFFETERVLF